MINIICALKCEAQPLIDNYQLEERNYSKVFPVYFNNASGMNLIISQPGKLNAVAATGYLHGLMDNGYSSAWLNVGIAGHQKFSIGTAVLAHKIRDLDTGQCWYPQILFNPEIPTAELKTLERHSIQYEDVLHDMEGAGFFQTALRFTSLELIHCLKIVSDNEEQPADKINKKLVSSLIGEQLYTITNIINGMNTLKKEINALEQLPAYFSELKEDWHFTKSEQEKLKRLLFRWQVLMKDSKPIDKINSCQSGKEIIRKLQDLLDDISINLNY